MLDPTRITQVIIKLVMLVLVGWAGMDSQHAGAIAAPVASAVVAVLLFIADELIHSARYAKLRQGLARALGMLAAVDPDAAASVQKTVDSAEATSPSPANGTLTKTFTSLLFGVAMLLIVLNVTACGATEKKKIGQTAIAINGTASAATTLLNQHILSLPTAEALSDALQTADAALLSWNAARLSGDATTLSKAEAASLSATQTLGTIYLSAQAEAIAKKSAATTQPK